MYVVSNDSPEVQLLFDTLRWLKLNRHVDVRVAVESFVRNPKRVEDRRRTEQELGRLGELSICESGCRSEKTAINHHKFVVISDTVWWKRHEPIVVQSSANWSDIQLQDRHRSAVMVWRDTVLAREYALRFESMRLCAVTREGCGAWNESLVARGLDRAVYDVRRRQRFWYDTALRERLGRPAGG